MTSLTGTAGPTLGTQRLIHGRIRNSFALRHARKLAAHRRVLLAGAIATALLAPGAGFSKPEQPRLYQLRGYVVRLDPETDLATIHNEKIEGWMAEMTMQYPVRSRDEYLSLRKGEQITGTVNVLTEGYWLTNVKERKGE